MKIRNGFVSNSSSSSFLIPINALTEKQIINIQNHIEVTKSWLLQNDSVDIYAEDEWDIQVTEKCVYGYTFMDNFNMWFFLKNILNFKGHIYWENFGGGFDLDVNLDLDTINRELLKIERKDKLNSIENK